MTEALFRKFSVKNFLKNFVQVTGKHICAESFFNKVAGLQPITFLKKRLRHRTFRGATRIFKNRAGFLE